VGYTLFSVRDRVYRDLRMAETVKTVITLSTFVVFILLMFYYPLVFMNLVYTHDNLRPQDIPARDEAINSGFVSSDSSQMERYQWDWFIVAISTFKMLYLIVPMWTYYEAKRANNVIFIHVVVASAMGLIDLGAGLYFGVSLIGCKNSFLCMDENPSNVGAGRSSGTFLVLFFFTVIFFFFDLLYLALYGPLNDVKRRAASQRNVSAPRDGKMRSR